MLNIVRRAPSRPNGLTGRTGKLPVVHPWELLPGSRKVYGANLALAQGDGTPGAPSVWAGMWGPNFSLDRVRRRLDECVQLGMNTARIPGTVHGIVSDQITRAGFFTRWDLVHAEAVARGLFVYPYPTDFYNDGWTVVSGSQRLTEITAFAAHLETLPDVIGIDLAQETPTAYRGSAEALTLYQSVKAVTTLPLTFSSFDNIGATTYYPDRTDFADYHVYHDLTLTERDNLVALWATGDNRPTLFGEYGSNPVGTEPSHIARLQNVRDFTVNATGARGQKIAGAAVWAIEDYDTVAGNQHGVFGLGPTFTEKTGRSAVVRTFPTY